MRLVVALGGNALLERGERPDAVVQLHHVRAAAHALAPLALEHDLIICHGNGPQVGLLALESGSDPSLTRPYPLDVLGAQTQGMIGYWLSQSLANAGVGKPIVNVTTQTLVDAADPAFAHPTKFIGAVYDQAQAEQLAERNGWSIAPDGDRWRRVVASPEPKRILELESVLSLSAQGTVVICGGGGGIPVIDEGGQSAGVEAVIDKDLTAALLAVRAEADRFLVLTDVAAVMDRFGSADAAPISRLSVAEARGLQLPGGSMGPKITACCRFVDATGRPASIGALTAASELLAGTVGTTIGP